MKYNKSLLVCCLIVMLSSIVAKAQFTYSDHSLTLRSDFPSKMVLLSNSFSDKIGDISPIIGAASWTDSGRQLQSRSLLEFNYRFLPKEIINDPSLIISAELILYPVEIASSPDDAGKPAKFFVRRVLECWEDSTTVWINQPAADSSRHVAEILKKKQKNKPVRVDVTRLVWDMLRFGNQGFMICNENSPEQPIALSQWFASPKYDNEKMRPQLVINFRIWSHSMEPEIRPMQRRQQQNTNSSPVTQPVITNRAAD